MKAMKLMHDDDDDEVKHYTDKKKDWDEYELDSATRTIQEYKKIMGNEALLEALKNRADDTVKCMADLKKAYKKSMST